jgi:DNA polymerase III sliding clamp (beta) subunit (PCNA family)
MKFQTSKKELSEALEVVFKAVSKTGTSSVVLSSIAIKTDKNAGKVILKASNGEMYITKTFDAGISLDGEVLVQGVKFKNHIAFIDDALDVLLELNPKNLTLTVTAVNPTGQTGSIPKNEVHFKGLDYNEFPQLFTRALSDTVTASAPELKAALKRTAYAAQSGTTSMPVTTGVNFLMGEHGVQLTAADGTRLARSYLNVEQGLPHGKTAVLNVPARPLLDIIGLLSSNPLDMVEFGPNSSHSHLVIIHKFTDIIAINLLEGNFPNIEAFLTYTPDSVSILGTLEFNKLLDNIGVFTRSDTSDVIEITLDEQKGVMNLFTALDTSDEIEREIRPELLTGPGCSTACSLRFLKDSLRAFEGDFFRLEICTGENPKILVLPTTGNSYLGLIMPRYLANKRKEPQVSQNEQQEKE